MFNTKKIITLSLLLTGVVGTSFCSDATQRSSWASIATKAIEKPQGFGSEADLMQTARSYYASHGDLSQDLINAVSFYNTNIHKDGPLKTLDEAEALRIVLSKHPDSPMLRGTPKASPTSITADIIRGISPLELKPSVSPTQFSPRK